MSQDLTGEHRYIDILIVAGSSAKLASYDQNFNETILKKGSEYTLAIDRFRIPMDDIPIFQYKYTSTEDPITHVITYNDNQYSVELEYNSVMSGRTYVQFITTTLNYAKKDPQYWSVWTVDIFIRMVNNALATAFATLAALTTLPTGALQPFFTFNNVTSEIAINAQSSFYDTFTATPIKIYMNQRLWKFFDGIPIKVVGELYKPPVANGRDIVFLLFNTFNNIITYGTGTYNSYYKMISDNGFECVASWNVAKGFYFRSNNIPVRNEIMPTVSTVTDQSTGEVTQRVNNNVIANPIISNFDFSFSASAIKPLIAQYILSTPYKVMDIVSTEGIKQIDMQVFWYDKYNNSYPLSIRPNDSMSIRLLFQEKPKK